MADASRAEVPEGAFDILFSRFGVMFFDDPTGAFAHMRRALKPGGRVGAAGVGHPEDRKSTRLNSSH